MGEVLEVRLIQGAISIARKAGGKEVGSFRFAARRSNHAARDFRDFLLFLAGTRGSEAESPKAPKNPPPINLATGLVLLILAELASTDSLAGHGVSLEQLMDAGVFGDLKDAATIRKYLASSLQPGGSSTTLIERKEGSSRGSHEAGADRSAHQRWTWMPRVIDVTYVGTSVEDAEALAECPGLERLDRWLSSHEMPPLNLTPTLLSHGSTTQRRPPALKDLFPAIGKEELDEVVRLIEALPRMVFGLPTARADWDAMRALRSARAHQLLPAFVECAEEGFVLELLRAVAPLAFYFGRYDFWRDVAHRALKSHWDNEEIVALSLLMIACSDVHLGKFEEGRRAAGYVKLFSERNHWRRLTHLSRFIMVESQELLGREKLAMKERRAIHQDVEALLRRVGSEPDNEDSVAICLGRYNARAIALAYARMGDDAACDQWLDIGERLGKDPEKWAADAATTRAEIPLLRGATREALDILMPARSVLIDWQDDRWLCSLLLKEAIAYELMEDYVMALGTWKMLLAKVVSIPIIPMERFSRRKIAALEALTTLGRKDDLIVLSKGAPGELVGGQVRVGMLV